jgi:hypothetical protein
MREDEATRAMDRLSRLLDAHRTERGIALDSRSWLITGRRG